MRSRLAILATALALVIAGGCGQEPAPPAAVPATTAAPASTPSQAEADQLAAYLAAIDANGGGVDAVAPARLLATGQLVCERLDHGATRQQAVAAVRAEPEGYAASEAETLIAAATEVLCPQHAAPPPSSSARRASPAPQPAPAPDPNDETDAGLTDPCLGPDSDPVECSDGYSDDSEMTSSGEEQYLYGCEQGYIPPEDC